MKPNGSKLSSDLLGALRSQIEPLVRESVGAKPLLKRMGKRSRKLKRWRVLEEICALDAKSLEEAVEIVRRTFPARKFTVEECE